MKLTNEEFVKMAIEASSHYVKFAPLNDRLSAHVVDYQDLFKQRLNQRQAAFGKEPCDGNGIQYYGFSPHKEPPYFYGSATNTAWMEIPAQDMLDDVCFAEFLEKEVDKQRVKVLADLKFDLENSLSKVREYQGKIDFIESRVAESKGLVE